MRLKFELVALKFELVALKFYLLTIKRSSNFVYSKIELGTFELTVHRDFFFIWFWSMKKRNFLGLFFPKELFHIKTSKLLSWENFINRLNIFLSTNYLSWLQSWTFWPCGSFFDGIEHKTHLNVVFLCHTVRPWYSRLHYVK